MTFNAMKGGEFNDKWVMDNIVQPSQLDAAQRMISLFAHDGQDEAELLDAFGIDHD
jgi:hypothetical protein